MEVNSGVIVPLVPGVPDAVNDPASTVPLAITLLPNSPRPSGGKLELARVKSLNVTELLVPSPKFVADVATLATSLRLFDARSVPAGRSAATRDRNAGVLTPPPVGPANIVFAVWVANVPVNVPDVEIGEPLTVKTDDGSASATLVT